jgi:hypothetical protein
MDLDNSGGLDSKEFCFAMKKLVSLVHFKFTQHFPYKISLPESKGLQAQDPYDRLRLPEYY